MEYNSGSFKKANKADWKEAALKELKGKPFEENLVKQYLSDIALEAFQNAEDAQVLPFPIAEVQNTVQFFAKDLTHKGYSISADTAKESNKIALAVLKQGASALHFETKSASQNIDELLREIQQDLIIISFPYQQMDTALAIINALQKNATIRFEIDITQPNINFNNLVQQLNQLTEAGAQKEIHVGFFLSLKAIATAGANFTTQLAVCQSIYHDVINTTKGDTNLINRISFHLPQSVLLLPEIAKMRALALIQGEILTKAGVDLNKVHYMGNKTSFNSIHLGELDPPTNLIRLSSYAFGAFASNPEIAEMCSYCNPCTLAQHQISLSVATVLEEESHLNHYSDPAAGSYYLEALTQTLFKSAQDFADGFDLTSWQEIQKTVQFQATLNQQAQHLQDAVASGDFQIIGENKYPPAGKEGITSLNLTSTNA